MRVRLAIGDFSRMTHLSVKALRHYHDLGLLEPAEIDPASGYRFYEPSQVPIAQVIRRFRDLGMPPEEIKEVLEAPRRVGPNPADGRAPAAYGITAFGDAFGAPLLSVSPTAVFLTAAVAAFLAGASALTLEQRLPSASRLTPRPPGPALSPIAAERT
jgi:DNA-binding transcriptional MerR regulator